MHPSIHLSIYISFDIYLAIYICICIRTATRNIAAACCCGVDPAPVPPRLWLT